MPEAIKTRTMDRFTTRNRITLKGFQDRTVSQHYGETEEATKNNKSLSPSSAERTKREPNEDSTPYFYLRIVSAFLSFRSALSSFPATLALAGSLFGTPARNKSPDWILVVSMRECKKKKYLKKTQRKRARVIRGINRKRPKAWFLLKMDFP